MENKSLEKFWKIIQKVPPIEKMKKRVIFNKLLKMRELPILSLN
jgi:hypothetical protein